MKFEILGGSLCDETLYLKAEHVGYPYKLTGLHKHPYVTMLTYRGGWDGEPLVDISRQIRNNLNSSVVVTDENKVNFTGALGWGIVGSVLTGGIRLMTGALSSERGNSMLFAMKFKDGTQFLCEGEPKDVIKFQMDIGQS